MKKISKVNVLVLCLLLAVSCCAGALSAFAFNGIKPEENGENLFSLTNTYNCTSYDEATDTMTYDMSTRRNVQVMERPQITVLMHGLGGIAADWSYLKSSNKDESEFIYDKESLIERLQAKCGQANVYWAKMTSKTDFDLIDLNAQSKSKYYVSDDPKYKIDKIIDTSKHIIIVFEAFISAKAEPVFNSRESNKTTYFEFNHMLSKVVRDVTLRNEGILPKINLVGYSRGGLITLMYALDHPDMVDSLVSIGTPYFGTSAGVMREIGLMLTHEDDFGLDDILDEEEYASYSKRWNDNYDRLYKDINAVAIGGYTSLLYLSKCFGEYAGGIWNPVVTGAMDLALINLYKIIAYAKIGTLNNLYYTALNELILKQYFPSSFVTALDSLFTDEMKFSVMPPFLFFENDIAVNLDSALAQSAPTLHGGSTYKGFRRKIRLFNYGDGTDFSRVSRNTVPVPHNLEARDRTIIGWVLSELDTGVGIKSDYAYSFTEDGTVRLEGYRGKEPTVLIPETIAGVPVTEIGQRAFEGELEKYGITSITIPKTVKVIGASAFANNKLLTNVTFEENSELQTISSECFAGCESLENVTLPNSLMNIQSMAFYGCNSLASITLPKNVVAFASDAVMECETLANIFVEQENRNYKSENGVLFQKNGIVLECYPCGKTDFAYSVPESVLEIQSFAFMGNKHLRSVYMSEVAVVRQYAFLGCENLSTINCDNLDFADEGAFENTAWLNGEIEKGTEFIEKGNFLIKYNGTASELVLTKYCSVASLAFFGNNTVKNIVFEDNDEACLANFKSLAFFGCEKLESITIKCSRLIFAGENIFGYNEIPVKIYVRKIYEDDYKTNEQWRAYKNDICFIETNVSFDSNGGSAVGNETLYFGSPLELSEPQKAGYIFDGWYYEIDGEEYKSEHGDLWLCCEPQITFTAKWTVLGNSVTLYYDEFNFEMLPYMTESGLILPVPEREGYTFDGWYESEEFTGEAVTEIAAGEAGDRDYYAKWIPNKYVLTLNYNYDGCPVPATEEIEFGSAFKLDAPEREGYIFDGWRYNGILLTNENGESVMNWNIADNVELKASWTRKKFAVKIDKDGKFLWLNEQSGFSDAHTWIPYGTKFDSWDLLLEAFEPEYKEGHKFAGFEQDGEEIVWDELPDLGENGITVDIEAHYIKEKDFVLRFFITPEEAQYDYITGAFGERITLPSYSSSGNVLKYWKVADCEQNEKYAGSQFAVGNKFEYNEMPDLSFNIEEDGWELYLVAELVQQVNVFYNSHGGSVSGSGRQIVRLGERPKFPIPTRKGYVFLGWYFGTTGSNGTGEACTNSSGIALEEWNRGGTTYIYAKWQIIVYNITYRASGKIEFRDEVKFEYTIETPTFLLPQNPLISQHRFLGWFIDAQYTKEIRQVITGSTGNLIIYGKFAKLHSLTYYIDGQARISQVGIYNETIRLYDYTKTGYTCVWSGNLLGNSLYTIPNHDVDFNFIGWKAKEYDVILHLNLNPHVDVTKNAKVKYGQYYQFEVNSRDGLIFCGWYFDGTEQLTGDNGKSLKTWDKDISRPANIRAIYAVSSWTRNDSRQYLITDSGRFDQPYDCVRMDWVHIMWLMNAGYTKLHVELTFTAWEKDDGVQYAFIYDGTSSNATLLSEFWFSHGGDKKNTTPKEYTFTADITLHKDLEILCFRYGASGKFDDDWYNKNLKVTVTPVK